MSESDIVAIARLEEKVDGIIDNDKEYRRNLCDKMAEMKLGQKEILDKVIGLPCVAREVRTKAETRTQALLWTGAWICIGCLFTLLAVHLGIWK
jgi:hypothetical protein